MTPEQMAKKKAEYVALYDLPGGVKEIKKSPLAGVVRGNLLKKVRTLPGIKPAECEDITQTLLEIALQGGQRQALDLDALTRVYKPYVTRCDPTGASHEMVLQLLTMWYREAWKMVGSMMDITMEDFLVGQTWTERQVANGAEPTEVLKSELVDPNDPMAGVTVWTEPMKPSH